jgi:hypothetical protein
MKWTADGELSDHDFELIMKRLLQVEEPARMLPLRTNAMGAGPGKSPDA